MAGCYRVYRRLVSRGTKAEVLRMSQIGVCQAGGFFGSEIRPMPF